jgi:hypothetical protein
MAIMVVGCVVNEVCTLAEQMVNHQAQYIIAGPDASTLIDDINALFNQNNKMINKRDLE